MRARGARNSVVGSALALAAAAYALSLAAEPATSAASLREETIALKDGPGRELTVGRCNICHSLEYIPSNAPAMNRAAWQKNISKMKERFGAPIADEEAKQILDYLDASYSGKTER